MMCNVAIYIYRKYRCIVVNYGTVYYGYINGIYMWYGFPKMMVLQELDGSKSGNTLNFCG